MKQEEYFGMGSIKNLSDILKAPHPGKIFLATGKKSYESSGAEEVLENLIEKYEVYHFNDFSGNPKIEDIEKGLSLYREFMCDTVIAIGGGSVIDTAKSINIIAAQDEDPVQLITGKAKIVRKGKPLIVIPTTAGSGSEATHFAVVYIGKEKYSIAHEYILPDKVILDPQLTFRLTPEITATSGIDAFCQAVESYWSVNSNEESKRFSSEAIELILENLASAVNNPSEESRTNMLRASNLAGKAINISKTTAPHAISYSLTSYFGIPHGQAVSLTLGEFLVYNYEVSEKDLADPRGVEFVRRSINEVVERMGCKDVNEARSKIISFMKSIGLKTKLSEFNVGSNSDLRIIIDNVNLERLRNNPRAISGDNLKKILSNIL